VVYAAQDHTGVLQGRLQWPTTRRYRSGEHTFQIPGWPIDDSRDLEPFSEYRPPQLAEQFLAMLRMSIPEPQKALRNTMAVASVAKSRTKLLHAILLSMLPVVMSVMADSMPPNGSSASTLTGLVPGEKRCRIPRTVDTARNSTRNVSRMPLNTLEHVCHFSHQPWFSPLRISRARRL